MDQVGFIDWFFKAAIGSLGAIIMWTQKVLHEKVEKISDELMEHKTMSAEKYVTKIDLDDIKRTAEHTRDRVDDIYKLMLKKHTLGD